jgi:hypothetical protein
MENANAEGDRPRRHGGVGSLARHGYGACGDLDTPQRRIDPMLEGSGCEGTSRQDPQDLPLPLQES